MKISNIPVMLKKKVHDLDIPVKIFGTPLTKVANSRPMRWIIDESVKDSTMFKYKGNPVNRLDLIRKHLPAAVGLWIGGFYIINTLLNKDIPKERKTVLNINNATTTLLGVLSGYTVEAIGGEFVKELGKRIDKLGIAVEDIQKLKTGLNCMFTLVAFTLGFRLIAPVLATPISDKINKFLIKRNIIKASDSNSKPKADEKSQQYEFLKFAHSRLNKTA